MTCLRNSVSGLESIRERAAGDVVRGVSTGVYAIAKCREQGSHAVLRMRPLCRALIFPLR